MMGSVSEPATMTLNEAQHRWQRDVQLHLSFRRVQLIVPTSASLSLSLSLAFFSFSFVPAWLLEMGRLDLNQKWNRHLFHLSLFPHRRLKAGRLA